MPNNSILERALQIFAVVATIFACYVSILAISRPEIREPLFPFIASNNPEAVVASTVEAKANQTVRAINAFATAQSLANLTVQAAAAQSTVDSLNNQGTAESQTYATVVIAVAKATAETIKSQGTVQAQANATIEAIAEHATTEATIFPTGEPTALPKQLSLKQARASSYLVNHPAEKAFDGSGQCERGYDDNLCYSWVSSGETQGTWLEVTLESIKTLTYIEFFSTNIRDAHIIFDDGSVQKVTLKNLSQWQTVELVPRATSRIRIVVDSLYGDEPKYVVIVEMQVWGR